MMLQEVLIPASNPGLQAILSALENTSDLTGRGQVAIEGNFQAH